MHGRKPKPTHLKLVTGNPGKRRINRQEPQPIADVAPMPPPHLYPEAMVEWGRLSENLFAIGILTGADRAVMAAYCQCYARWVRAEQVLARRNSTAERDDISMGLMVRTLNGNAIQNPLVGIANKAMADMVRYAAELGITPSARSRVQASARQGAQSPAAKYLA